MKCPLCAEEIKDAAILCRFCGAIKDGAIWRPPVPPPRKSTFTIRFAAVCFLLSALFEGSSLTTAVPLFGSLREGAVAGAYHLFYVGLFLAMGIGLWMARPWGLWVMFGGTIIYTVDKVRYLLDSQVREVELSRDWEQLQGYQDLLEMLDPNYLLQMTNWLYMTFVGCWWGFLLYLYLRRDYFKAR